MRAHAQKIWTEDEYLAYERASPVRHEFMSGVVVAMSGASRVHSLISGNLFLLLAPRARAKGCEAHTQAMQVRVRHIRDTQYFYPDVVVACDRSEDDTHTLNNPCLIVEVLSPSTAALDRREKMRAYLSIPSLKQYILVDQDVAHIESLRRTESGWMQELLSAGDVLKLECLEGEIPFEAVYAGVDVPPPGSGADALA